MYEDIRHLIADNDVDTAFSVAAQLRVSDHRRNQLLTLRRRWSELEDNRLSDTEHAGVLRVEQNKLTADFLEWIDQLENDRESDDGSTSGRTRSWGWLIGVGALLLVATIWIVRQGGGPSASERSVTDPRSRTEESSPSRTTEDDPTATATPPEVEERVNPTPPQTEPPATAATGAGLAVALYRGKQSPTAFDPGLSRELAAGLMKMGYAKVSSTLVPDGFHSSKIREDLQMRGKTEQPAIMDRIGARFLLLVDLRGYSARDRVADLRFALYDGEIDKGYTFGRSLRLEQETVLNAAFYERLREFLIRSREYWDAEIAAPR